MTDTAPRSPKFRRRSAERPDEVLDAALHLFTARGYDRTTMADVGLGAGLSKAAVYLYFPSKQALLQALVRRAVGAPGDAMLEQARSFRGDPRPVLGAMLRQIAGRLADPKVAAVPALILREAAHAPEIAEMYRAEVLDRFMPVLTHLIAQGVQGGHIRAVDPDLTLRSIVGPVMAHVLLGRVFGLGPDDPGAMGRLIDNHLMILNAGLDPGKVAP
jgi:AcrR family transcriptional regulator